MTWQTWAQILGAVMVVSLILPGVMRLRGQKHRFLSALAAWLGLIAVTALILSLMSGN